MRDSTGGPSARVRLVALATALGLLLVSAPLLIALVRWVWGGFS